MMLPRQVRRRETELILLNFLIERCKLLLLRSRLGREYLSCFSLDSSSQVLRVDSLLAKDIQEVCWVISILSVLVAL